MYLPPLQTLSEGLQTRAAPAHVSGDVSIHPHAAIAPGAILQAAPNSRIVVAAGACIGMGAIIEAHDGTIEIQRGAVLGAGVLAIGRGTIGEYACVGAATTIWNASVDAMQVVEAGSILGDRSRSVDISDGNAPANNQPATRSTNSQANTSDSSSSHPTPHPTSPSPTASPRTPTETTGNPENGDTGYSQPDFSAISPETTGNPENGDTGYSQPDFWAASPETTGNPENGGSASPETTGNPENGDTGYSQPDFSAISPGMSFSVGNSTDRSEETTTNESADGSVTSQPAENHADNTGTGASMSPHMPAPNYGQAYIHQLLVTLFPHRHPSNYTPANDNGNSDADSNSPPTDNT